MQRADDILDEPMHDMEQAWDDVRWKKVGLENLPEEKSTGRPPERLARQVQARGVTFFDNTEIYYTYSLQWRGFLNIDMKGS